MSITTLVTQLIDAEVTAVTPLRQGGNSSVYRVALSDGQNLAAKHYPPAEAGNTDRLQTEVKALNFLTAQGLDCIPSPLNWSENDRIALFSWVKGEIPSSIGQCEIDAIADFLTRLHDLRRSAEAQRLPLATECVLSADELERQLARRMERLQQVKNEPDLSDFLSNEFQHAWERLAARARDKYRQQGLLFSADLTTEHRTLSPSDFGFHNTLQDEDNKLSFVDFEYFGWDDPVKLVADFLWHPAMSLSERIKTEFVTKVRAIYRHDDTFEARIEALYPLYGLRWCMILLNEFLPQGKARRVHANALAGNEWKEIKQRQLKRSRCLLDEILRKHEKFPY